MTDNTKSLNQPDSYVHDYDETLTARMFAGRTAETHAAFFLPHLKPEMSLLDCGSGPGTITAGLAQIVSPGKVIGIEFDESQVELASEYATKLGLANVQFEQGSVYDLPYPDNQFDAVFSHAMLDHLFDPVAAIKEMRRVLKPGGVVGLRCGDLGTSLITPADDTLERAYEIYLKYRASHGGDPSIGRRCRTLLREAGFAETIGLASCESFGTPQVINVVKSVFLDEMTGSKISETAIEQGWADQAQMDNAVTAINDWAENPDAMSVIVWFEGLAWKEK